METANGGRPNNPLEAELARLFAVYREACPAPEPGPEFMPRLWERIERQSLVVREFRRLTEILVGAAVALSLLMGVMLSSREPAVSFYTGTYVEILAANYAQEAALDPEAIPAEQGYFR